MSAAPRDLTRTNLGSDGASHVGVDAESPSPHIRRVRVAQGARIAVLGPLRIGGVPPRITPRDRVVLEALTMRAGDNASTEWLADALWGDTPPASATKNLQGCIARLRKELGHDAIETTASGYRLTLAPDDIDSRAFEQLVQRARELLSLQEPDRAAYVVDEALAMFAGDPLDDLTGWDAGAIEAQRLQEIRLDAEELRVDALLAAGQHDDALPRARGLVAEQPLRERRHVQLAVAQYRAGQQSEALATLRALRERLVDELGVDPGPEATALEQSILLQDPELLVEAPSGERTSCPWPGLTSYDVGDQESFCGRDTETAGCLRLLHERGVLAVVGPSGSGKSSLLRAGIAASLRSSGREVSVVSPGRAGSTEADVIARTPIRTVLLVDQLEEVFAPGVSLEHRAAYLDALVRRGGGGELVVALRADRTPELAGEPRVARLLERGWYLLSAMGAAELRIAIERPARQAGLLVEPGLIDLLVREVQDEPGALPLLSHSLAETWSRRERRTLTVDGYVATGGVRGSIAQSAEAVYSAIPADQRHQLRDLLMRLVAPGPEGEPTRMRVSRERVVTRPEQERLVELLVGSRLLTSDDGNLTLAHEALAREWPRLRGWLDDDVDGQRILHHLSASADAWEAMGRPDSEVYRGVRLAGALEWSESSAIELASVERDFLEASLRLRSVEERSAEEQIRAQTKTNRRLRVLLAAAVVLLLVATGLGFLAQRNSDRVRQSARARQADAVGAQALTTPDISTSLLLAAASAQVAPSRSTQADLAAALAQHGALVRTAASPGDNFGRIAVAPDGNRLVVAGVDGTVYLYDAHSLELLDTYQSGGPLPGGYPQNMPVAFSPDGMVVAVGVTPRSASPVTLVSVRNDRLSPLPRQLTGWPSYVARATSVTFSADGRRLAVFVDGGQGSDGFERRPTALVWEVRRPGTPIRRIALDSPVPDTVMLDPGGHRLYVTTPLTAYDVDRGRRLYRRAQLNGYGTAALAPAGNTIALWNGGAIDVIDARTGRLRRPLAGMPEGWSGSVRFSPDGRLIAARDDSGAVYVWRAGSGELLRTIASSDTHGVGLAFSPDGRLVYTAGVSRQLREWDLAGYDSFLSRVRVPNRGHGPGISSPDGSEVAYAGNDERGRQLVWFVDVDARTATRATTLPPGNPYIASGWAPDGRSFAEAVDAKVLDTFDPRTGRVVGTAQLRGSIVDLGYTADGRSIVVAAGRNVEVLDARTLKPRMAPLRIPHQIGSIDPSPDGNSVFVSLLAGPPSWRSNVPATTGALVDLHLRRIVHRVELDVRTVIYAAFSPRGDQVAVLGQGGQVLLVSTRTWRPVAPAASTSGFTLAAVTYSPDGSRLLTAGGDQAQLWDTRTGQQIGVVSIPGGANSGGFRADGTIRLTDTSGGVYNWDPSLEHEIRFACQMAGRDITYDEWHAAFPDLAYRTVCPD